MLIRYRLAAVDLHTATHLVKRALSSGLAQDRTIILVTHHISLCLPVAAHFVELSAGAVVRSGSTCELRERGELEKLVDAEDTVEEDDTEASSETEVENEADLAKANGNGFGNGHENRISKNRDHNAGKLVEEEARAEGRVSMRTYWTYIKAAGIIFWIFTVLSMLAIRFINVSTQVSTVFPFSAVRNSDHGSGIFGQVGRSLRAFRFEE